MVKRTGRHPDRALTAVRINALKTAGRYADGNGLYLVVEPSGAKRWLLRTIIQGRRRDIGLGGLSLVTLAEARVKALAYRKVARDGGDPLTERRQAQMVVPTFAEAADQVHADQSSSWKNPKHRDQWINTLRAYAVPEIGTMRVNVISTPDVLRVLSPIWLTKPETARRVRQRISTVLDWAKAAGFRSGDNPVEGVERGLPRQADRASHHAALPYMEAPAFITQLRSSDQGTIARLAFEFLILTAARTNEAIGAAWSEMNISQALWTVPASRMKSGREHRVPLSQRAIDILGEAKLLAANSVYVFPGRSDTKPMSNMVFLMGLRRKHLTITAHGFRSTFRDWSAEATNIPQEGAEMALAHVVKNKTEAAYRRGDLLEKRRELMDLWANYLDTPHRNGDLSQPVVE